MAYASQAVYEKAIQRKHLSILIIESFRLEGALKIIKFKHYLPLALLPS